MEVYINQELKTISENSSLFSLLETLDLHEKKGIAIAINNSVIPKSTWNGHQLQSNDKITVITATQGG